MRSVTVTLRSDVRSNQRILMWIGSKLVATNRVVFAVVVARNVCQKVMDCSRHTEQWRLRLLIC